MECLKAELIGEGICEQYLKNEMKATFNNEVHLCANCEASCYGHCYGEVRAREFIFHCRPRSKYNIGGYDKDVQIGICDNHYRILMLETKGKTPEMYGWDLDDALDILLCCDFKDKYTFWYCDIHHEGYLIKSNNTDEVSRSHIMCNSPSISSYKCNHTNWHKKGIINYDGKKVTEIEEVLTNYNTLTLTETKNKFDFIHYSYEYFDEYKYISEISGNDFRRYYNDNFIMIDEDSVLTKWFKDKINFTS